MLQTSLNTEMVSLGTARYHGSVGRALERHEETHAYYGQRLLSASLGPYIKAIQDWLQACEYQTAGRHHAAYPLIKQLPADLVAFIAAKSVLDSLSLRSSYARSCVQVGALLEDEVRFRWLKKHEPVMWKRLRDKVDLSSTYDRKRCIIVLEMNRKEKPFVGWSEPDRARVGMVLLELFINSTGLLELKLVFEGRKKKTIMQATQKTVDWIQKFHEHAEVLAPFWLPTVELPIPWTTPFGGAYSGDLLAPCHLVKRCSKTYLEQDLQAAVMPEVYRSVNLLQSTPWKINQRVLGVMQHYWGGGAGIAGLPQKEDEPIPTKPVDIATNEEARRAWRRKAHKVHSFNAVSRSQRLQAAKVLWLAQKFSSVPKFYFPHQLDFRGRAYCIPYFLHPQGSDLSRSLLLFAQGKSITTPDAVTWLAIYGANLWGFDKVSFEAREAWTLAHRKEIEEVAKDPLATSWWREASEPWQFLAWCIEWSGWLTTGWGFKTHLPVCVDGTNNGLQILSLLVRDERGGAATNVVQVSDTPADIYQDVANLVIDRLRLDSQNPEEAGRPARFWLDFGLNRKTTKRPVMVFPYGGTFYSCAEYVREWFADACRETGRGAQLTEVEQFSFTQYLAGKVWESILECIGRPKEAMAWFQECAEVFVKHGLGIRWTTPVGFPVYQAYKDLRPFEIKTALGNKITRKLSLPIETDKLSKPRQVNGVSPNVVHSLDAAALHRTVALANEHFGIEHFCMIHDSYGVLAPEVETLSGVLRHSFASLFTPDILANLRAQWQAQLPDGVELPPVPAYGTLNPEAVRSSSFFFA